jgi:hypothetical protein
VKSLLHDVGFRPNRGAQELEIAAMDAGQHSTSIILPVDQMPEDDSADNF